MALTVTSHASLPSARRQIEERSGTLSPTFQPVRSATPRPIRIPVRSAIHASRSCSGMRYSGYMRRNASGLTGKAGSWLRSFWYQAPNQVCGVTSTTPSIARMRFS